MVPEAEPNVSQWRELAANGVFQRYWAGVTVGALGFAMLGLPLELYVLDKTGSAQSAATIVSCIAIAQLFCAPVGGWFADRFPRKKLLLTCEIGRAVVCATVIVLVIDSAPLWTLFLCCLMLGVVQSAGAPARAVMLRDLVSERTLVGALRQDEVRINVARVAAPLLGGALYSLGNSWVFGVCLMCFALSALVISSIPTFSSQSHSRDIADSEREPLRSLVLGASGVLLGVAAIAAATAAAGTLVVASLRGSGTGADELGAVLACEAIGGIAGAALLRKAILSRVNLCISISLVTILSGVIAFGLAPCWASAIVLLIATGGASAITGIALDIAIFQKVDKAIRGRAISTTFLLVGLGGVAGRLAMGSCFDAVGGADAALYVAGCIACIGACALAMGRTFQREAD